MLLLSYVRTCYEQKKKNLHTMMLLSYAMGQKVTEKKAYNIADTLINLHGFLFRLGSNSKIRFLHHHGNGVR